MSNNNQNATEEYNFCTTELKTATKKFIWTIKNFSEHEKKCGECLESTEFTSTAPNGQILKWRMYIYPIGITEEFKDYVSLFLYLIKPNNEEVKAKFQLSIRKSDGKEVVIKPISKEWLKFEGTGYDNWGKNKLIKRDDLLNKNNGYLEDDQLTIECTVTVKQELVEKAPLPNIEVPECRGMEDVSHLFEQSLFWDCKIKTEDEKEFKVHKCILGCRSPVFAAMFEHEMIEKNNNEVKIEDMKGDVIDKMLRFIYSGKEPDFGEMAEDLLEAADKYELIRLKLLCERKLINSLNSANACELLLLADLYSAGNLKAQAIDFIKTHLKEVKKSGGWKNVLANQQLMEQILDAAIEK